MDLEEKIRHITYIPTENTTRAIVELKNGFQFECEVHYVNPYCNSYGEKYAKEQSIEWLQKFAEYAKLEQSQNNN